MSEDLAGVRDLALQIDTWGKAQGLEAGACLAYSRSNRSQCDEDRISEEETRGR